MRLLLADDDAGTRTLLASFARRTPGPVEVLEAEDGARAVQLALERRPHVALLDVDMPKLGGIEAALTLCSLQPGLRLALYTADPQMHHARARAHGLLLFDQLERHRALRWLERQVQARSRRALECAACGYGIVRAAAPARCPMCHARGAWISTPRRRAPRGACAGGPRL